MVKMREDEVETDGRVQTWVDDVTILGCRTQMTLKENGAGLNLGLVRADELPKVTMDLGKLQETLKNLVGGCPWRTSSGNTRRWRR